jgi:hypothetical protein
MSSCTDTIKARLQSLDTFNAWKNTTSAQLNAISANAQNGSTQPSPAESNTFATLSADIFNTTACIQAQLSNLSGTSNTISQMQQEILRTGDAIAEAEADISISRDRVAYIRNPEQHTSYYESWFPLDRPMHVGNVPFFVAATMFVLFFGLLLILSFMGVDFNIVLHPMLQVHMQYFLSQFTWLTFFQGLVLLYALYYFTRNR